MSFLRALRKNLFEAPYPLLPHAVFVFYAAAFLLHPLSPIYTHRLNDPDDYMRLNEVINWLGGQGWYDLSQPRLSPGAHTVIHWSRLVDLPIAFFMQPFVKFYGMANAALLASFIVPPLLLVLLLSLVPALAAPFTGNRANIACLFILFAPMMLFNFTPGRVDHHAYQILIAGFGLFCLGKMNAKKGWRFALMAAGASACALWVGTEGFPWLCLFLACLGLWSAWEGGMLLRNAAIFGAALPAAMILVLFAALPVSEFSSRALSWFSPAFVIFACCAGSALLLSWLLGKRIANPRIRLALVMLFGAAGAALFALSVPDALVGPFADYDSFNSTTALDNISEARPLWHAFWIDPGNRLTWLRAFTTFAHAIFLPLLALIATFFLVMRTKRRERPVFLINGVYLLAALLLTLFWQGRVGYFMELFSIAPLTWLLLALWKRCGEVLSDRALFWAEIGYFLLLGPMLAVIFPAAMQKTSLYPDLVLFPAKHDANSCDLAPAAKFLDQHYAGKDVTIMAGMNEGPQLLFSTPFKYIGGNYNVAGNPDVFAFFRAEDDATPRAVLRKWNVSAVLTCRNVPPFLMGFDLPRFGATMFLHPGKDGKLRLTGNPSHPPLIERLIESKPPVWLKPVEIPGSPDYLLYEVRNNG